jgi:hypothetical protein
MSIQGLISWRSGYQVSDTERPEYTALIAGFQIGIRRGARSFQMRSGFYEAISKLQQLIGIKAPIRQF